MPNTLTIGLYVACAAMAIYVVLWIYRRGKAEGASQQKDANNRKVTDVATKYAKRVYDGVVGTRGFSVLKRGKWKPRTKP